MGKYSYTAIGPDGATVSGTEQAESVGDARVALLERDLQPIRLEVQKSVWQYEITRKKVPPKELMHFSRQLAVFVRAGVPILDALRTIAEENTNKVFKTTLLDMVEQLQGGSTFAGAAASHPEAFPRFYLGILRAAEVTGTLDAALDQLADYIDRDLEAKRKITSALIYPAIVMLMSIGTVAVLAIFVMPRFKDFFKQFDAKLPIATRILLDATNWLTTWWWALAAVVGGVVVLTGVSLTTEGGRAKRDALLLKLPVLGDVIRDAVLERFCRVLSSMVHSGVPLPEALAVTSESTNNAVYQRGLQTARAAMVRGEGLAGPLAATGLFPPAARQMLRVGEDTGTLDDQLETAAVYFDRELDYKLKRFTSLFEPAVIIFMGLVVGFVAIALVSAMYGLFRQVNVP